jgi:uncharacterized Zn finger protein
VIREAYIRRYASNRSFERGREYLQSGAVTLLASDARQIKGEVQGSACEPYGVEAIYDESGDLLARCDCPYDHDGWCKHIVAVLLAACAAGESRSVNGRPLAEQIAELADFEREALLADACRQVPEFVAFTQRWLGPAPVDSTREPARREMLALARTPDLSSGSALDSSLERLLDRALCSLDDDRASEAISDLAKATERSAREYETIDDSDGDFGEFILSLGRAWIDAAIMFDGPDGKRRALATRVGKWSDHFDDYGVGDPFAVAVVVLEESVERASRFFLFQDERPDVLQRAQLRVMARRGQIEEYLVLARETGASGAYLGMLLCTGDIERALSEARKCLKSPSEALQFGRLLEEARPEDALEIGELALSMRGERYDDLAYWVRDLAMERGKRALALRAARAAVLDYPTLDGYRALKSIAGARWKRMRAKILASVKAAENAEDALLILIDEGLVAEAIGKLEQPHVFVSHETLDAVVRAAIPVESEWAIRTARDQAEQIMNPGTSKYYHHAGRWLTHVRAAYQASNRDEEWRSYRTRLLLHHKRRHKLVAVVKSL